MCFCVICLPLELMMACVMVLAVSLSMSGKALMEGTFWRTANAFNRLDGALDARK